MENQMEKYSDDDLLTLISMGNSSPYAETGLFKRAQDEWRIRQQQKVFDTQNEYNKNILKANKHLVYATIALVIVTLVATALQIFLLQ